MTLEILDVEKIERREVGDEDIRRIAEIAVHPEVLKWCPVYRDNPDLETRVERLSELFDQIAKDADFLENRFLLLAKLDGKIVGYSQGHRFSMPHENHVGDIEVIVHPEYQRKGVGYELLKNGIKLAREKGFKRLVSNPLADNKATRRTLERGGFQLEGIRRKAINMHGQLKDEASNALLL